MRVSKDVRFRHSVSALPPKLAGTHYARGSRRADETDEAVLGCLREFFSIEESGLSRRALEAFLSRIDNAEIRSKVLNDLSVVVAFRRMERSES